MWPLWSSHLQQSPAPPYLPTGNETFQEALSEFLGPCLHPLFGLELLRLGLCALSLTSLLCAWQDVLLRAGALEFRNQIDRTHNECFTLRQREKYVLMTFSQ